MHARTIGAGVAMALFVAGVGFFVTREDRSANPGEPFDLAGGARIYGEYCASCHGADLRGEPNWRVRKPNGRLPAPPQDETGHTWHHPDTVLFEIVKRGTAAVAPPGYESDMPGFGDKLSDAEIRDVLAYIRSRWPAEIRARQAEISAKSDG